MEIEEIKEKVEGIWRKEVNGQYIRKSKENDSTKRGKLKYKSDRKLPVFLHTSQPMEPLHAAPAFVSLSWGQPQKLIMSYFCLILHSFPSLKAYTTFITMALQKPREDAAYITSSSWRETPGWVSLDTCLPTSAATTEPTERMHKGWAGNFEVKTLSFVIGKTDPWQSGLETLYSSALCIISKSFIGCGAGEK